MPKEWLVACSPDFQRDGTVLRGSFDSIPADSIGMTLRPPVPAGYDTIQRAGLPLIIGVAVIGLAICWWWGGSRTRREALLSAKDRSAPRKTAIIDLLRSLVIGMLYALAVLAVGLFFAVGVDYVFPPDATELEIIRKLRLSAGYGQLFSVIGMIFLSFVSLAVGFVTALFAVDRD